MPVDMQSFIKRAHYCYENGTRPYREAISYATEIGAERLQNRARQDRENIVTISDDDITR